jgi:hypothetical protein
MSGPGGSVTKRDTRRATRQEQYQQRQQERQRARQREIQRQRMVRYGAWGGGVLVLIILIILAIVVSQFVIHGGSKTNGGASVTLQTNPASGQAVDGLTCLPQQGGALHIHQYLDLYINGQRVNANPGIGIVNSAGCLYPLHVHDNEVNIIHNESATMTTFTLGQFFDIWGVNLSSSQVGQYKVDSAHKLVVDIFDANGKMTVYTGNPYDLQLNNFETIYILYNSPGVHPTPYGDWSSFQG